MPRYALPRYPLPRHATRARTSVSSSDAAIPPDRTRTPPRTRRPKRATSRWRWAWWPPQATIPRPRLPASPRPRAPRSSGRDERPPLRPLHHPPCPHFSLPCRCPDPRLGCHPPPLPRRVCAHREWRPGRGPAASRRPGGGSACWTWARKQRSSLKRKRKRKRKRRRTREGRPSTADTSWSPWCLKRPRDPCTVPGNVPAAKTKEKWTGQSEGGWCHDGKQSATLQRLLAGSFRMGERDNLHQGRQAWRGIVGRGSSSNRTPVLLVVSSSGERLPSHTISHDTLSLVFHIFSFRLPFVHGQKNTKCIPCTESAD